MYLLLLEMGWITAELSLIRGRGIFFLSFLPSSNRILISLVTCGLPIQQKLGTLLLRVNKLGCDGDPSPPHNTMVRKCKRIYLHSLLCSRSDV
jgi:hypothetical protein